MLLATFRISDGKIGCRIRDNLKGKHHTKSLTGTQTNQVWSKVAEKMNEKKKQTENFRDKLLVAFAASNIALGKLDNPHLRSFLQWLIDSPKMDVKVPSPRTFSRNLRNKYFHVRNKIKRDINDNDCFFLIDETPDAESRNVVNVMVGKLDGKECKPRLIHVAFPNVVNIETIQKIVMDTCGILWKGNMYPHLKLIISDQAAYMIKAVKQLKKNISFHKSNLLHVSCVVHAIHLVCESIKKENVLVNTFLSKEKKFFKKSGKKKRLFRTVTGIKLPPFPIEMRWGSWLSCVNYHLLGKNFEKIKSFFLRAISDHDIGNSDELQALQQILRSQKLSQDMFSLSKFSKIPEIIKQLETRSLELVKQQELIKEFQMIIRGTVHERVFLNSLSKNPDYDVVTGESQSLSDRMNFKFCPLVNCEIERSFSVYRDLLTDKRRKFTKQNLKYMMVLKCNADL